MTDRTLDRFLAAGLLAELKGDDGWYSKLAAAADSLAKRLADQPDSMVPNVYAALDAKILPEDDAIAAAEGLLREQWRSFASVFTTTPVLLMRAVILDAIVGATKINEACSEIAALLIGSALPNLDLGREAPVWQKTFTEIADKVEQRAETQWSVPSTISVQPMSLDGLENALSFSELDANALAIGLAAAAGPQANGQKTQGNPHWPSANEQWTGEFAARAAASIKEAIEGVLTNGENGGGLSQFSTALAEMVSAHVDRTAAQFAAATVGLELRSRLLWWKEALYSPTAFMREEAQSPNFNARPPSGRGPLL